MECRIRLFFIGLLIIGIIGYLTLNDFWVRYIFAHLGGLGIVGIIGCWAGSIAKKKGRSFWKALLYGFVFPIILGILSVIFVLLLEGRACGGSISIVAAILVVFCYYFASQKNVGKLKES